MDGVAAAVAAVLALLRGTGVTSSRSTSSSLSLLFSSLIVLSTLLADFVSSANAFISV